MTKVERSGARSIRGGNCLGTAVFALSLAATGLAGGPQDAAVRALSAEVQRKGWIVYAARSEKGDWDLFACRPDGSSVRNLTATPDYNEAAPQVSIDGRRLLYRRLPRKEPIDGNRYGVQGCLVLADGDGTDPKVLGKPEEYPWATWSPDGRRIACLSIKGISVVDLASGRETQTFDRKGFFQQLSWSPDGRWFGGVANSYGTGWSVARIELATGEASAVNRVDCCTPDWFPDSQRLIFSWRPPGQKGNNGQGWTQLWMTDIDGKSRQLVYGEDGRHVYGGQVSPDGLYALFTGNAQEDGDPGRAGAPMGLMRLADAPIIGGESKDLRALHQKVNNGPGLALPAGWEPCWTFGEILAGPAAQTAPQGAVASLAAEIRTKGWVAFSAATDRGDWDLFLMRPDGSDRRRISDTPEHNEAGVRFSPDGKMMLYYRMSKNHALDNNTYGTFDLVVADAGGANPVVFGDEFRWASWGPDSTQLACLTQGGVRIVEVASRKTVRQFPRKGIVQQLVWSPDGRWFAGTANGLGPFWNIARLGDDGGEINAVSEVERYNCTPDWLPDSERIMYSRGIVPEKGGKAELYVGAADGKTRRLLYAEANRHMYGGCVSPDGGYVLFTRSVEDLGKVDNSKTSMSIIRWADTPMLGDQSEPLQAVYPMARPGPRLDLGWGWEPHWTFAEIPRAAGR